MSKLLTAIKTDVNFTLTENGALTHASTLNDVLDFYYHAPARRGQDNTSLFNKALAEDKQLALRALCYLRDVRGGQGERETFRQGLRLLEKNFKDCFAAVLPHVSEYGRWDDILEFVDNKLVQALVKGQLASDVVASEKGDSVSLLAKWLPSANASSPATKALARKWVNVLGISERVYRKTLSALRAYIQVVETQMSAGKFTAVNYSRVPSKASLRYRTAFHKRDGERYTAFLEKAIKGEVKINAGTLYPYDLVGKYLGHGYSFGADSKDLTVEAQWKQLPNYADTDANALVVCDVSGSMFSGVSVPPITVAVSLAIYIAERNKGIFKDHFITFSDNPKLVKIQGDSLWQKCQNLSKAEWGMSTNVQAAFDLVLNTAVKNRLPQEEIPSSIFIVSDMEFNSCCRSHTNFEHIKAKFAQAGYTMPKLVFWNVNSKNNQTPVTQDEKGTFLVSGCSPSIFAKAINTESCTPLELMLEVLNSPRYERVVLN
jgi:hypothetical protein